LGGLLGAQGGVGDRGCHLSCLGGQGVSRGNTSQLRSDRQRHPARTSATPSTGTTAGAGEVAPTRQSDPYASASRSHDTRISSAEAAAYELTPAVLSYSDALALGFVHQRASSGFAARGQRRRLSTGVARAAAAPDRSARREHKHQSIRLNTLRTPCRDAIDPATTCSARPTDISSVPALLKRGKRHASRTLRRLFVASAATSTRLLLLEPVGSKRTPRTRRPRHRRAHRCHEMRTSACAQRRALFSVTRRRYAGGRRESTGRNATRRSG